MSTGYTYTDRSGRPMGIDTLSEEVWLAVPKGNLFISNEDAPTVAAEILKAAGQEGMFIPKEHEEVERLGDELTCGSGREWVGATIHANPNLLRNRAANWIAIAEYIENKDQREAETERQKRRVAVLAALLPEAAAVNALPEPDELSTLDDRAIDRIIELEDGQVNR